MVLEDLIGQFLYKAAVRTAPNRETRPLSRLPAPHRNPLFQIIKRGYLHV